MLKNISKRGFSAKKVNVKQLQALSKMHHVRLNFKEISENINMIKQNTINRNA